MSPIVFEGVCVEVPQRTILHPTSIELGNHRIAVIGANGSGKSTFLKLINGLVQPTYGHVTVSGLDTIDQARQVRGLVGFAFAAPEAQLIMPTVSEDLEVSLAVARRRNKIGPANSVDLAGVLTAFGLSGYSNSPVLSLSGGQKQLLALAGVVVARPQIILCDEPTTRLDLVWRRTMIAKLLNVEQQVILATHDLELAQQCQRAIVIDEGWVVFDGPPDHAVAFYRDLMEGRA